MGLDQTAIFSSNSTSREPDPDSVLVNTVREVLSPDGVAVIFNGAPKHRFGAQEFEELLAGDEELEHEVGNSTRHFCIKWGHQCVLSLHGPAQACLVLALRSPDGIAKPCSSGAASSVSAFNFNFFIVGFQFVVLLLHCRLSICGVAPSLSAFNLWCCSFIVGFHSSFSPHLLLQQFFCLQHVSSSLQYLFPVLMQQTAQRRTTVFPLFVFLELMLP